MELNLGWILMDKNEISILYVEDEASARESLSHFIDRFCARLYLAENGEEGLALYKEKSVDIVISDIKMPKMNGLDMVEQMKKINKEQLVIFTTAHIDSEYLFKAIELQVDGYVAKPVDLDKLKVQIEKCIMELNAKDAIERLKESEERAMVVLETSQLGVFIYKEKFLYANDIFAKLVGYTKEELYTMDAWGLTEQKDKEFIQQAILKRLKGESFPLLYKDTVLIGKENKKIICRIATETIQYEGGYAGLGTVLDITDVLHTQERLKQLAQAMEQMDEMVRITDKDGYITYVNEALTRHTGYKKSELIGSTNKVFKSGKHSEVFYKKMYDVIEKQESYQATFINAKKNGELYYEDQVITPILDEEQEIIKYYVSTSKDITQSVKMQEKMKILATRDSLTGLKNRYSINAEIESEIKRVKRYKGSFALMMFDIDFFKRVNDTYGHDVGDYVLKEFSSIVVHSIRDTDSFGRWGGEEFLLLAPQESLDGAMKLAEKVRKDIETFEFDQVKHITVSIGLTICNAEADKEKLLKKVDEALYEAKESGRNRVVYQKCTCGQTC